MSTVTKEPLHAAVVDGDGDPHEPDVINVLVVDDHVENLLALVSVLEQPGLRLVTAGSGRDALRSLLKHDFAVILLDVNMPGMDGFETAAMIRSRAASIDTPIIFITAHGDESHVVRAYSLRAVDYITAPVNPDVVKAKVSVFVELHRRTLENRRQGEQLRRAEEKLRRQAEQQLHETHARLQQIIESVVDYAIFSLDLNGCIATWNAGAERLFLYDESEVIGQYAGFLLDGESNASSITADQCGQAIAHGQAEIDSWFKKRDGARFYGTATITPIRGVDGRLLGFSKVVRDITERKHAEDALQQQASDLAEANRLKDEFLAVLSHELRTPLNAIIGWAHMLLNDRTPPEMKQRGAEAIARNGQAQLALVNDILDVSRFVTGKFRMNTAAVDLREVTEAAVETGQTAANARRISLALGIPPESVVVNGDAARLQQVVWNLVSNAVKFTPEGGRVEVVIATTDYGAHLAVRDNGAGISPEFLPHVFERFRQADSSTSRAAGGLGLGLAIAKHIVELHGGTVRAESDGLGVGSTFSIFLPVVPAEAFTAREVSKDREPGADAEQAAHDASMDNVGVSEGAAGSDPLPFRLTGIRCLIVDDDADTRHLLTVALDLAGAKVVVARSAEEALEAAADANVMVSDIAMPGQDGYSLIRRIRGRSAASGGVIPAIALTAHVSESERAKALEAGFNLHISKPADPSDVVRAIAELLGITTGVRSVARTQPG